MADPDVSGVSYQATWWRGVPLDISGSANGGPDPIAQGADLVTVAPGQARSGYDTCFGCDAIGITSVRPGPNTLTVAFTPPDINRVGHLTAQAAGSVPGTVQAQVQADAIAYTVTCTPVGGGQSARASGSGSPVVVTGLLTGTSYTCQVLGAVGGTVVATSVVSGAATVPAATPKTTGETASNTTDAGGFAFTGAASTVPLARASGRFSSCWGCSSRRDPSPETGTRLPRGAAPPDAEATLTRNDATTSQDVDGGWSTRDPSWGDGPVPPSWPPRSPEKVREISRGTDQGAPRGRR